MTQSACLRCGRETDGTLRVSVWEEEEKGRLAARPVLLCEECHAGFLRGEITRVEIARAFHAKRGYEPAEWIQRIDRDSLLDIACLSCGILLPVAEPARDEVECSRCHATNRFGERITPTGRDRLTVALREPVREATRRER